MNRILSNLFILFFLFTNQSIAAGEYNDFKIKRWQM